MAEKVGFVPPHNFEAEMAIIGSILIDKEALFKIADLITPQDFYRQSHADIFEAVLGLFSKQEPIDILSLSNRLHDAGKLEQIGGQTYLGQLAESVPTSSHIAHYAKIVQKAATLRRLITASQEITHLSFDRIDDLHKEKGKLRGVPTGFGALDNLLAGLQPSDLVILAARPSVGKTSFALDIARNVAVRARLPVGVFSLEMSKEQLVDRMICAEANVDLWKMRTGKLSDAPGNDDFPRIGHALGVLSEAPVFIDDSPNITIMEIRTKVRRLQKEQGRLGLIIVDYLQLMESKSSIENRVQEVAAITRGLKGIAREMNVPVLALSQLSRAVEQSKPAIPKLAHLRESGSIEQDADVVMFIYRKAADRNYRLEELAPEERHIAEIHIAKHRNGPTGTVKLFFDENRANFKNLDTKMNAVIPVPAAN
jgi:replicative DNA helicase